MHRKMTHLVKESFGKSIEEVKTRQNENRHNRCSNAIEICQMLVGHFFT